MTEHIRQLPPDPAKLASRITDRSSNPRGWLLARDWIEKCLFYEAGLREVREMTGAMAPEVKTKLDEILEGGQSRV